MTRALIVYALKRLAIAIPVLLAVSLFAFFLSRATPGDIVDEYIAIERDLVPGTRTFAQRQQEYTRAAQRLNRHLPAFYFNIRPGNHPDTLYRILRKDERNTSRTLLSKYGNWESIDAYRHKILQLLGQLERYPPEQSDWTYQVSQDAEFLLVTDHPERIDYLFASLRAAVPDSISSVRRAVEELEDQYAAVRAGRPGFRAYVPILHWHGLANQYHRWLADLLRGDFGISLVDGRPVTDKVWDAIGWTLRINLSAILLAFLISIPLGVAVARRVNTLFDKGVSVVLFAFFAIPSFWLATLFVVFLTTPEYGQWTDLFPTSGVGSYRYLSGFDRFGTLVAHLFLPVLCLLLAALAYVTRQMRGAMLREIGQDYIRMARAKGLSDRAVYWNHAFRNALFPMITLVGAAIPASISGSVIIEVIFNIPGMGRLLYDGILRQDWPVVFSIVLVSALLTVVGYLVSDLLYRIVDPRVRFAHR